MALVGSRNIRIHVSVTPQEHARIVAAATMVRAASVSHFLGDLGVREADRLGVPADLEPVRKRSTKRKKPSA